jgi:hypothetical protein
VYYKQFKLQGKLKRRGHKQAHGNGGLLIGDMFNIIEGDLIGLMGRLISLTV